MKISRQTIQRILTFVIVTVSIAGLAATQGCQKSHTDKKRDKMVWAQKKVAKVLKKELHQTDDQLMMHRRLSTLGVNEENKVKLQRALKKEFGISLPYNYLGEKETVGSIVRYMAWYKDDLFEKKPKPTPIKLKEKVAEKFGSLDEKTKLEIEKRRKKKEDEEKKLREKEKKELEELLKKKKTKVKTKEMDFNSITKSDTKSDKSKEQKDFGRIVE